MYFAKVISICLILAMVIGIVPMSATNILPETEGNVIEEITEAVNTADISETFVLPDIIDSAEATAYGYIDRVRAEETDLNTLVFKNQDGTNTMRVFNHPVKYVDENGITKDISLELKRTENGSFTTVSHEICTVFSKNLSDGITLEHDDISIKMLPVANKNNTLTTTEMSMASMSSDKKSITYPVDSKTSYDYQLTYAGFKEDIVVKEYTGQTEYNFILQTNGLTLTKIQESYFLTDADGEIRATIGDIIVFTADERNNTLGSMTYQTIKANNMYAMTIHLDADYLSDPDTVYPIRIDPTVEVVDINDGAGAIEDVTINSQDTSSGSSGSLYVGLRNTYGISRVLMRFPSLDLSNMSTINSAYVKMRDLLCPNTATTVTCHPFTGNTWSENNVDWSTVSPNSYGTQTSSLSVSYSNGVNLSPAHWYSFNIKNIVEGWKNGVYNKNKGILFKSAEETITKNATFASYNRTSNQPSLSITYTQISIAFNSYYSEYEYWRNVYTNSTVSEGNNTSEDNLQSRSNCYGYAFRMFYCEDNFSNDMIISNSQNPNITHAYSQQVGEFTDKTMGKKLYSSDGSEFLTLTDFNSLILMNYFLLNYTNDVAEKMYIYAQALQYDAQSLGYTMTEYTGNTIPDASTLYDKRMVAVVINSDFHFYMQHSDNTWSHKLSYLEPTNLCLEHAQPLTNQNIMQHIEDGVNYENGSYKFFYITKNDTPTPHLDGCYSESIKTSINSSDYAGNKPITSKYLTSPISTISGNIDYLKDEDCYRFYATDGYRYMISWSNVDPANPSVFEVSLYNSYGVCIDTSTGVMFAELPEGYYILSIKLLNQTTHKKDRKYYLSIG